MFGTMTTANEEVWCDVSDDEMYNPCKDKKGTWEPKAEDILSVFKQLKSKKVLDLHWKCPGRRHPDSDVKEAEETREEKTSMPNKQEEKKPTIPNEFDFDDDDIGGSKTVLTPRRTPGSAPKSQKKEAKMDKILKDMMYQRKLQAAEREARKLAGAKSPRTPASPGRARIGSPAGSPRTPNRQSPVRLGAGPADHITTTPPVRAPLDQQTALRVTKTEPNTNLNVGHHKTYDTTGNLSTSQNIQTSQTGTPGSNMYAYQSQSANVGETLAQNMIRDVTASPQRLDQSQQFKPQPSRINESRPETSQMKPQPSRTNESRPETSQMKPQPSRTNESRPETSQMKPLLSRTNESRPETSQMKPQPNRTNESRPETSQMKPLLSRTNESRPETSQMKPQPSRTNESRPETSQMTPLPANGTESRPETTITTTELLETLDKMDTS